MNINRHLTYKADLLAFQVDDVKATTWAHGFPCSAVSSLKPMSHSLLYSGLYINSTVLDALAWP